MKISAIAAIGKNRELGKGNKLLWHISEDFRNFKNITMGHTLVMGRKTYESIGKPLPGRKTIVLTSDLFYEVDGDTRVAHSLEEVLAMAKSLKVEELFICGGGKVYKDFLPYISTLYLSLVDFEGDADTFFPPYAEYTWNLENEEVHTATGGDLSWKFRVLTKDAESY